MDSPLREVFRRRRIERGITQEDAAQWAGLSRKTVSDFENGKSSISVVHLSRLLSTVGLELTFRDARRRPTLDELPQRYG